MAQAIYVTHAHPTNPLRPIHEAEFGLEIETVGDDEEYPGLDEIYDEVVNEVDLDTQIREADAKFLAANKTCYVCRPGYGIEAPCFGCGSYRHETEFCKQDTVHTCRRTHVCADEAPCGCDIR